MRIKSIHTVTAKPIDRFDVLDLSDVVVIAGANGVGKTRLLEWLIQFLQNLKSSETEWISVEATYSHERTTWGKTILDTRNPDDVKKLISTLHRNRKRAEQKGTVLYFESNRAISQIKPYQFTWESADPFNEEIGWNFGFQYLRNRFQDTRHSIYRKIRNRRESLAEKIDILIKENEKIIIKWIKIYLLIRANFQIQWCHFMRRSINCLHQKNYLSQILKIKL